MKLAVLASGRGSNLQSIMEAIAQKRLDAEIVKVISNNPEARALVLAAAQGIETAVLLPGKFKDRESYDRALAEQVQLSGADWVVLAGFMRLVSSVFLQFFPGRVLNIHPSLLPAFPGVDAQRQAVDYGVKYSGCTVHFVDEQLDHGPIIAQRVVEVSEDDTPQSLADKILAEEHKLFPQVLQWLAEGRVRLRGRKVAITEVHKQ